VHLEDWPVAPAEWTSPELAAEFEHVILEVRVEANARLESLRQQGGIGKALDATVRIAGKSGSQFAAVLKHQAELAELLNVSLVEVKETASDQPCAIDVIPARELGFVRCPRCWRWVPALGPTAYGAVCPRCADALKT
jgi:isoleucyl-tRNA synthetase